MSELTLPDRAVDPATLIEEGAVSGLTLPDGAAAFATLVMMCLWRCSASVIGDSDFGVK